MNGSPATSQDTEEWPFAVLLDPVGVTGVCGWGEAGEGLSGKASAAEGSTE